ncbi:MAG: tRNA pseudouridine(38-40) synthase TruA [Lachnospiraceae bacterium]|nr:tRNA pseudouridine(38-40) synthase TruA [Lachnospiraceae bacterium]
MERQEAGNGRVRNFRIALQYDGTRYKGWQRQSGSDMTIQGKLEHILTKMCGETVTIAGAGRTDAGVHAREQIANFHIKTEWQTEQIGEYINRYLPEDIRVTKVQEAGERFHSRLNVTGKTYRYVCLKKGSYDVFSRQYTLELSENVQVDKMRKAAAYLLGTHDFSSFCTKASKKKSTVRRIDEISITEDDKKIIFSYSGNGFLYNMVRIITGTLLEVGMGKRSPEDIPTILERKNRKSAGETAPAKGLILWKVYYD